MKYYDVEKQCWVTPIPKQQAVSRTHFCDDYKNCPLYHALMSQLEDDMKRWQNKIKYIDEPIEKMSRADRVQYYQGKIDEIKERLININDFMRKRNENQLVSKVDK